MPRGIPNKKHEPTAATQEQANGTAKPTGGKRAKGINKMQCVREALGELGNEAQPKDIQDFLKRKFRLDMTTQYISTYKSGVLKEAVRKSGIIRLPAATPPTPAPALSKASSPVAAMNGGISVEDIRDVKGLADRLGVDKVRALIDVLYE